MENDKRKQAIAAIIQKSDKFLFVKRSDYKEVAKGYWCPVTGHIEEGETQEEAVQREVLEEVGMEVIADRKVCQIPTHDDEYTLHFWTTRIISGEASIMSHESTELRWLTREELKHLEPAFDEDIEVHLQIDSSGAE